ncbi:unnamed protein product, partial [Chrysoparadoxa australica]
PFILPLYNPFFRRELPLPLSKTSLHTLRPKEGHGVQNVPSMTEEKVDCEFLVVGGGSAGCALASKLAKAGRSVLLVEAGSRKAFRLGIVSFYARDWFHAATSSSPLSSGYETTPQEGLAHRMVPAWRGRGCGGCSLVNAGLYQRGRRSDYEAWPWSLGGIEESFQEVEEQLALEKEESKGVSAPLCWRCSCRRASGAVRKEGGATTSHGITLPADPWTTHGVCNTATSTTHFGGKRQSAWEALVLPTLISYGKNLTIMDNCTVKRVIIKAGRAVGVEVAERGRTRDGQTCCLSLSLPNGEVIICAGIPDTPKILMLSGRIGPSSELVKHGIAVKVDLPHVGKNLQEHLLIPVMSLSRQRITSSMVHMSGALFFTHWETTGKVKLQFMIGDPWYADTKASLLAALLNRYETANRGEREFELHQWGVWRDQRWSPPYRPGWCWQLCYRLLTWMLLLVTMLPPLRWLLRVAMRGTLMTFVCLVNPVSAGTVTLASSNPQDPANIDPRYLTAQEDLDALWEGFNLLKAAHATPIGKEWVGRGLTLGRDAHQLCFDQFKRMAQQSALPYFHASGACRMGTAARDSVVSHKDLRVHGLQGLRVADASVAPVIPSAPTQAMAMMIGARAGNLILES